MIAEHGVRGALLCWQDFIRSTHITQRNFLSNSGVAKLTEFAATFNMKPNSAVFEHWIHVGTQSRSQVLAEVCACRDLAVGHLRAIKDTREQWYAAGGIRGLNFLVSGGDIFHS